MLIGSEGAAESATQREGAVDPSLVFWGLPGHTREALLQELARRVAARGVVADPAELAARLLERERLGCTGLGGGIAIPHCKMKEIDRVAVAVATTAEPVDFGAVDGMPITLIFLVISPANGAAAHLQALARVSRMLRLPSVAERLRQAPTREHLLETLREAEAALSAAP